MQSKNAVDKKGGARAALNSDVRKKRIERTALRPSLCKGTTLIKEARAEDHRRLQLQAAQKACESTPPTVWGRGCVLREPHEEEVRIPT
jgi:hypothetical protein